MENAAVLVSTPFQLLSAIAITEQFNKYTYDLYIVGNFTGYKELAEKVKETGVFEDVRAYEIGQIRKKTNSSRQFITHLEEIQKYIMYDKTAETVLIPNKKYGVVFFAAAHSFIEIIFYAKKNWNSKFYLFDDGVMTYRNIKHCLAKNGLAKYFRKIVEMSIGKIDVTCLLYMPELFRRLNDSDFNIEKLHPISKKNREVLLNFYNITDANIIEQNTVVIECKADDYLSDTGNKRLEGLYEKVIVAENGDVVFKRHPRDRRDKYKNRKYIEGNAPFELITSMQNITNKLLIAWDSTSVITPKLFWSQEPRVILLYKIVEGKIDNLEETDRFYQQFKECYNDMSRFFIPESEDELDCYLGNIGTLK